MSQGGRRYHEAGVGSRTGLRLPQVPRDSQGNEDLDAFFQQSKKQLDAQNGASNRSNDAYDDDESADAGLPRPDSSKAGRKGGVHSVAQPGSSSMDIEQSSAPSPRSTIRRSQGVREEPEVDYDEIPGSSSSPALGPRHSRVSASSAGQGRNRQSTGTARHSLASTRMGADEISGSDLDADALGGAGGDVSFGAADLDMGFDGPDQSMDAGDGSSLDNNSGLAADQSLGDMAPEGLDEGNGSLRHSRASGVGLSARKARQSLSNRRGDDEAELSGAEVEQLVESDVGESGLANTHANENEHAAARKGRDEEHAPDADVPPVQVDKRKQRGKLGSGVGPRIEVVERIRTGSTASVGDDGLRRGKRHRFGPLEWWRGERARYGRPSLPAPQSGGSGSASGSAAGMAGEDEFESMPILAPVLKEVIRVPRAEGEGTFAGMKRPTKQSRAGKNKKAKRENSARPGQAEEETPIGCPEEGWDEGTDPYGLVWDMEKEEEAARRIACTLAQTRPRAAFNASFSFEKVFGVDEFMAAGVLVIPEGGEKPTKPSKDNNYTFVVLEGAVRVRVHRSNFLIAPGGMFLVPKGNTYSIENVSRREVRIFFAQARRSSSGGSSSKDLTRPQARSKPQSVARSQTQEAEAGPSQTLVRAAPKTVQKASTARRADPGSDSEARAHNASEDEDEEGDRDDDDDDRSSEEDGAEPEDGAGPSTKKATASTSASTSKRGSATGRGRGRGRGRGAAATRGTRGTAKRGRGRGK